MVNPQDIDNRMGALTELVNNDNSYNDTNFFKQYTKKLNELQLLVADQNTNTDKITQDVSAGLTKIAEGVTAIKQRIDELQTRVSQLTEEIRANEALIGQNQGKLQEMEALRTEIEQLKQHQTTLQKQKVSEIEKLEQLQQEALAARDSASKAELDRLILEHSQNVKSIDEALAKAKQENLELLDQSKQLSETNNISLHENIQKCSREIDELQKANTVLKEQYASSIAAIKKAFELLNSMNRRHPNSQDMSNILKQIQTIIDVLNTNSNGGNQDQGGVLAGLASLFGSSSLSVAPPLPPPPPPSSSTTSFDAAMSGIINGQHVNQSRVNQIRQISSGDGDKLSRLPPQDKGILLNYLKGQEDDVDIKDGRIIQMFRGGRRTKKNKYGGKWHGGKKTKTKKNKNKRNKTRRQKGGFLISKRKRTSANK